MLKNLFLYWSVFMVAIMKIFKQHFQNRMSDRSYYLVGGIMAYNHGSRKFAQGVFISHRSVSQRIIETFLEKQLGDPYQYF